MVKKVTDFEKKEILRIYKKGMSIKDISLSYNFSMQTIIRQLKAMIGEKEFKKIKDSQLNQSTIKLENAEEYSNNNISKHSEKSINNSEDFVQDKESVINQYENFFEITPLIDAVNLETQRDISSISISGFVFPNVVFMIVDKKIELETKYLKDFPDWDFLSEDELDRKTIQIFNDIKTAKRFCGKDQKVIKVPNPKVFKMVAPILISRGISRIVSEENLIAL